MNNLSPYKQVITLAAVLFSLNGFAQQIPDATFDPVITAAAYENGQGSEVQIDEAHHNFHTITTRYLAFSKVLINDGYVVKPNTKAFTEESLKPLKILVIANAVHESDTSEWVLPNPSAFTQQEITALINWVSKGGSLFFIADHMPFPGAGDELAKAFGFTFYNGFATDTTAGLFPGSKKELDIFERKNGTLQNHPITQGKNKKEVINRVATFTGQAFQIPAKAVSLISFDDRYKVILPDTAWKFNQQTKRIPIKNFSQGAVLEFGKGRVAVFGEAAMFTAQRKGKEQIPFGLNSPDAGENLQFLLNLVHWLDKKI